MASNRDQSGDDDLVFHDLPPFPDDVPTVPLLRLSLQKLIDRDPSELQRLWKACVELGFFYLDLRHARSTDHRPDSATHLPDDSINKDGQIDGDGLLADADALFALGEAVFALPTDEKQRYDFKDQGSYFGYKGLGAGVIDQRGTRDANEFYNVAKSDMLGLVTPRLPAPVALQDPAARALLARYIQRSHAIVALLCTLLDAPLGLPPGTLPALHRLRAASDDQVRWVHAPPRKPDPAAPAETTTTTAALGEHTDFGSLTILFNRLGGLQVLPPGEAAAWSYVRPLRGHAVCNLGDAMVKLSAGLLRSNVHRVVGAPGAQAGRSRMSLVYFARPEDEVVLVPLAGQSAVIAREVERKGLRGDAEERITAKEWTLRRAMGRRGVGSWKDAVGTEGPRVYSAA